MKKRYRNDKEKRKDTKAKKSERDSQKNGIMKDATGKDGRQEKKGKEKRQ